MTTARPPLSVDQLLDLVGLAGIDTPVWTPDGSAVVVASPLGGRPDLWAFPVDGGAPWRLTSDIGSVGHLATAQPRWSPDGRWLSYVTGDIGRTEVWLQPADGTAAFQLTRIGANISAVSWAPDGRSLVLSANRYGAYDVFRVHVPDGAHERLTHDDRYEVHPTVTPDGSAVLYVRLDTTWTEHEVVRLPLDGGDPEVVLHDTGFFDYHYGRSFGYPTVSPDGATMLFRSYRSGWITTWATATDGSGDPRPVHDEPADQDGAAFSPDGRYVVMTSNHDAVVRLRLVDLETGDSRILVDPGEGVCLFPSWAPDGRHVAFTMATPRHPADLFVVEVATGDTRRLTRSVAPAVADHLAAPERSTYAGRDGLQLPAFLYRPEAVGVAPNGAGIVLVHGGPTMQWFGACDPFVQFLVTRGYAVLAPNIRGSSGYGRAFEEANDRDWCGEDLQDVVRAGELLRDRPDVDVGPVAVAGVSYGGIMSMAAAALTPDAFDAAVSLSGYGDFLHMMDEQEFRHQQLLRKELGDPVADREVYERASSIRAVRDVRAPIMLAHGVGRSPSSDAARQFAEALEREYKTFRYRTYPDEHYYVAGRANVGRLWQDADDFLRQYLDLDLR